MNKINWRRYTSEFLSIFVAVIAALALNNWNDNRRARLTEQEIKTEIRNGLEQDMADVKINKLGHENAIEACGYLREIALGKEEITPDSFIQAYFESTRDYISIQNRSGYESLKSIGLDLIQDKDLRFKIISLYEYDFEILRKFEEDYEETQFYKNYFPEVNAILSPHLNYLENGGFTIQQSPEISEEDLKKLRSLLWRINMNRTFLLGFYQQIEGKIEELLEDL